MRIGKRWVSCLAMGLFLLCAAGLVWLLAAETVPNQQPVRLTPEAVRQYDLVTIATAHTKVDYAMVCRCGVPVFDCKNVCKAVQNRENIEVL